MTGRSTRGLRCPERVANILRKLALAGWRTASGGCVWRRQIVIDYGCGTGSTSPLLLKSLAAKKVIGIDASVHSIEVARRDFASEHGFNFPRFSSLSPKATQIWSIAMGSSITFRRRSVTPHCNSLDRTLRPGGLFFALGRTILGIPGHNT